VTAEFRYEGGKELGKGGTLVILVDGAKAGEGRIERTLPFRMSLDETLDIGEDTGTAACDDYKVPFKFNGVLRKLTIDLK
jgi:arylsulfatase